MIPRIYDGKTPDVLFLSATEPKRRRDETAQWEHVPNGAERQGDSAALGWTGADQPAALPANGLQRQRMQWTGGTQSRDQHHRLSALQCQRSRTRPGSPCYPQNMIDPVASKILQ